MSVTSTPPCISFAVELEVGDLFRFSGNPRNYLLVNVPMPPTSSEEWKVWLSALDERGTFSNYHVDVHEHIILISRRDP